MESTFDKMMVGALSFEIEVKKRMRKKRIQNNIK
jgi:hypothetical protein